MNKWVGAGLVGLGVVALGGPYLSGTEAESQYHQIVDYLNGQAGINVVTESYQKGYFGADAVTVIKLDRTEFDNEMPQEVKLNTHFSHGITSVKAVSHFVLDESMEAEVKTFLGDKPPVEVTTTVNLLGDTAVVATTPEIDFTDPESGEKVAIAVFEMMVNIPSDHKQVTASVNWPGMSVTGEGGDSLAVGQLTMQQTGSQLTDYLWTSDMSMSLDSISGVEEGQHFNLNKMKLSSITKEAAAGRVNSGFEMSIDNVTVNGEAYEKQKLVFSLQDLAVAEFDALMATLEKLEETAQIGDPQQQAMAQMEHFAQVGQNVTALFNKGLKIDISELFVSTPKGEVNGKLHLEQPAADAANTQGPVVLLQTTKGDLSLSIPAMLLEAGGPEVQQQLQALLAQNFIVKQGDVYKTEARLENMVINVNGTEIPLPPLM